MLIDVWAVYQNGDDRSNGEPSLFYTTEEIAKEQAKGTGWWGGDAFVAKHKACKVGGRYYLITQEFDLNGQNAEHLAKVRKAALAKLTKEEKTALGLK